MCNEHTIAMNTRHHQDGRGANLEASGIICVELHDASITCSSATTVCCGNGATPPVGNLACTANFACTASVHDWCFGLCLFGSRQKHSKYCKNRNGLEPPC